MSLLRFADSITRLEQPAGCVLVTGSHGGLYPAYLAAQARLRGVIFNDAGIGLEEAGIAGLAWLEMQAIPAAAVDHASAPIGNAAAMMARGRISRANPLAKACGVKAGQSCAEAAGLLEKAGAAPPSAELAPLHEARQVLEGETCRLVLVDSAALVRPEDAGQMVITGSHGALFGTDPGNALKVQARLAVFNDAGLGPDEVGASRLPALQSRAVAAVTVAAASARIGDAASAWHSGRISRVNALAREAGAERGMALRDLVLNLTGLAPDADGY